MAQQTLNNGEAGEVIRGKINDNFTEVYGRIQDVFISPSTQLTNQSSTEQPFGASNGTAFKFNVAGFSQVRVVAYVTVLSGSTNTPRLYPQYSTDGSNWTTIGEGTIASGDAISIASTGYKETNWIGIPAGALGEDVYLRVAQNGGDGVIDPIVGGVHFQLR